MDANECTETVPGGPTSLAQTGSDLLGGQGMLLLLAAGSLIVVGLIVLLVVRSRRHGGAMAASALLLLAIVGGASLQGAQPASAAEPGSCDLLGVSDIVRHPENVILPGEDFALLEYTLSNVSPFPIEIIVSTHETGEATDLAAHFTTTVLLDDKTASTGLLSVSPASTGTRVEPGAAISIRYTGRLESEIPKTEKTAFDSVITARQLTESD